MTTEGEWADMANKLMAEKNLYEDRMKFYAAEADKLTRTVIKLEKAIKIALEGGEHDGECTMDDVAPDPEEECICWKGPLSEALTPKAKTDNSDEREYNKQRPKGSSDNARQW